MLEKKQIGILTLHSGFNEGAVLQALCLSRNLQNSLLDWRVDIIDHRYPKKTAFYGPPNDNRKRALFRAISELPLSNQSFFSDDHRCTFDYVNSNYHVLVTGSDTLWKLHYTRRRFRLPPIQNHAMYPAFPNVYWPDRVIRVPKIAYAACIGETDTTTIPWLHRQRMRSILSDFALLGVRDAKTNDFIRWLAPSLRTEWVPDPSFSIDVLSLVDREAVKVKLATLGVDFSRPRLGVMLGDGRETEAAVAKLRARGFQAVGFSLSNNFSECELFREADL